MNPINYVGRFAAALAGLAGALLALTAAAPVALARPKPHLPPGWNKHPPLPPRHVHLPLHTVVIGGMPGWQIALIAAGAAGAAATVAVLLDRARVAHRKTITATT